LDKRPLVFRGEVVPPGIEVFGFACELFLGEVLDLQEVDLPLEARDLLFELASAVLDGGVPLPEPSGVDLVGEVELVDLVGFGLETHRLPPQGIE
jgi:hypothetical protein